MSVEALGPGLGDDDEYIRAALADDEYIRVLRNAHVLGTGRL